jgi:hypothetical protein
MESSTLKAFLSWARPESQEMVPDLHKPTTNNLNWLVSYIYPSHRSICDLACGRVGHAYLHVFNCLVGNGAWSFSTNQQLIILGLACDPVCDIACGRVRHTHIYTSSTVWQEEAAPVQSRAVYWKELVLNLQAQTHRCPQIHEGCLGLRRVFLLYRFWSCIYYCFAQDRKCSDPNQG